MSILQEIVSKRQQDLKKSSPYKEKVSTRDVPLIDFFAPQKFLICELKKASPSRGIINEAEDFQQIIAEYLRAGATRFSVLTETNYFKGHLDHLNSLKQQYPDKGFLRKDFLYCEQDIVDSYFAGADAVLLISEILDSAQLQAMIVRANSLGLQTLCEVHSMAQLNKVLSLELKPTAIGINSRDLETFKVDISRPLRLAPYIPQGIKKVFESGVKGSDTASLAAAAGYDALLMGEVLMTSDQRIKDIKNISRSFCKNNFGHDFFNKLYSLKKDRYIKICGITSLEDASLCLEKGADALGFVLAPSKRRTSLKTLWQVRTLPVLKVAVVKDPGIAQRFILKLLLLTGLIDGVQLHGTEKPKILQSFKANAYKVISVNGPGDLAVADNYQPKVLFDAPKDITKDKGVVFDHRLLKQQKDLWLAGGLDPANVSKIIKDLDVELIDVSSGIESAPGKKSAELLDLFMKEVSDV